MSTPVSSGVRKACEACAGTTRKSPARAVCTSLPTSTCRPPSMTKNISAAARWKCGGGPSVSLAMVLRIAETPPSRGPPSTSRRRALGPAPTVSASSARTSSGRACAGSMSLIVVSSGRGGPGRPRRSASRGAAAEGRTGSQRGGDSGPAHHVGGAAHDRLLVQHRGPPGQDALARAVVGVHELDQAVLPPQADALLEEGETQRPGLAAVLP